MLLSVSVANAAWCGGHSASSCGACPWNGATWMAAEWCNGDCRWCNNDCKSSSDCSSAWCGGHAADSCEQCPDNNGVDMGADWCNGDCSWCGATDKCQKNNQECAAAPAPADPPAPAEPAASQSFTQSGTNRVVLSASEGAFNGKNCWLAHENVELWEGTYKEGDSTCMCVDGSYSCW